MATKTIAKDATDAAKATLSPAGSVTLCDDDSTLTISIDTASFTASENISKVEFWNDVNHAKGSTLLGTWYRTPPTGRSSNPPAGVSVDTTPAPTTTGVVITDTNANTDNSDDDYYYKVFTSDSRDADPELVLQKRSQPG